MLKGDTLKKRLSIEISLAELSKKHREFEKKWSDLRENCNHPIIVSTWRRKALEEMIISTVKVRSYCLCCSEHLGPRRFYPKDMEKKMLNAVHIDLEDYPNLCKEWDRAGAGKIGICYRDYLDKLYLEIRNQYPSITEKEVGKLMIGRLDAIDAFAFN